MSHNHEPNSLEIAEYLSLIASVVGGLVATVSGKVVFIALPVSVALLLNLINRLRLQQQTKRITHVAVRKVQQEISVQIKTLERQIKGKVLQENFNTRSPIQSQNQNNPSVDIKNLQQEIKNLQFQLQSRLGQLQLPNLQPIYDEIKQTSAQRDAIAKIQKELITLENSVNYVVNYLNNSTLIAKVNKLEKSLNALSNPEEELAEILQPLREKIEFLEAELGQLSQIIINMSSGNNHQNYQELTANQPPITINQENNQVEINYIPEPEKTIIRQKWRLIDSFKGHNDWVKSVAITPDGLSLITASFDGMIKRWNLGKKHKLMYQVSAHINGVFCLAISGDGAKLVSGGADNTITIWDLATGKQIYQLIDHTASIQAIAIHPHNSTLVSGGFDETIKLWDLDTGELIETLTEYIGSVYAIAISADGKMIASGGGDGTINLWRLDKKGQGFWLPVGTFMGNTHLISAMIITKDNQLLITANNEGLLNIWNLEIQQIFKVINAHDHPITALIITDDDRTLISGSADGNIKFWDLSSGNNLFTLNTDNHQTIISLGLSPDQKTLVSGGADGNIYLWKIND
jgi:WD40 repeat protein